MLACEAWWTGALEHVDEWLTASASILARRQTAFVDIDFAVGARVAWYAFTHLAVACTELTLVRAVLQVGFASNACCSWQTIASDGVVSFSA